MPNSSAVSQCAVLCMIYIFISYLTIHVSSHDELIAIHKTREGTYSAEFNVVDPAFTFFSY